MSAYTDLMVARKIESLKAELLSQTAPGESETTLTEHTITLTSSNQSITIPDTGVSVFNLIQDSTGSRTVSWPAGIRWAGDVYPTLSTASGMTDMFTFVALSGGGWLGRKDGSFPATATALPYPVAVMADGPVNYLRLDGNATDSGSRADTFTASVSLAYGASLGDGTQAAVTTDGNLTGPSVAGAGIVGATTATVELLARPTSTVTGVLLRQGTTFLLMRDATGIHMTFWLGGTQYKASGPVLAANTTYHLAGVYDGSSVELYVNGAVAASISATGALSTSASALEVGYWSGQGMNFAGSIDGVAIYRKTLSAARILAHAKGAGRA